MSQPPPAPDKPLAVRASGLAKVEHLRLLLADLGGRVGIYSGHTPRAASITAKTLRYFQFDKSTGLAKTQELRRIHAVLLKAVPAGHKTPFRARKTTGVLKVSDLRQFHTHWLGILKAPTTSSNS